MEGRVSRPRATEKGAQALPQEATFHLSPSTPVLQGLFTTIPAPSHLQIFTGIPPSAWSGLDPAVLHELLLNPQIPA